MHGLTDEVGVLERIVAKLADQFVGVFSTETVERSVFESYTALARTLRTRPFLVPPTERFATGRSGLPTFVVTLGRDALVEPAAGTQFETWETDEPSERGIDGIEGMRLVRNDIATRVDGLYHRTTASARRIRRATAEPTRR